MFNKKRYRRFPVFSCNRNGGLLHTTKIKFRFADNSTPPSRAPIEDEQVKHQAKARADRNFEIKGDFSQRNKPKF
jgi:hypothetical protein